MNSIHALVTVARQHETCTVCRAAPGQPCVCDRPAVHLCRVCLAARDGFITMADLASVMYDADVFTGRSLLLDPPQVNP